MLFYVEALPPLTETSILVSSAYKTKFTPWKIRGKWLMSKMNTRGTKIKPWGTPCKIEGEYLFNMKLVQSVSVKETNCVLCDK